VHYQPQQASQTLTTVVDGDDSEEVNKMPPSEENNATS
jgi:hypothetical protein